MAEMTLIAHLTSIHDLVDQCSTVAPRNPAQFRNKLAILLSGKAIFSKFYPVNNKLHLSKLDSGSDTGSDSGSGSDSDDDPTPSCSNSNSITITSSLTEYSLTITLGQGLKTFTGPVSRLVANCAQYISRQKFTIPHGTLVKISYKRYLIKFSLSSFRQSQVPNITSDADLSRYVASTRCSVCHEHRKPYQMLSSIICKRCNSKNMRRRLKIAEEQSIRSENEVKRIIILNCASLGITQRKMEPVAAVFHQNFYDKSTPIILRSKDADVPNHSKAEVSRVFVDFAAHWLLSMVLFIIQSGNEYTLVSDAFEAGQSKKKFFGYFACPLLASDSTPLIPFLVCEADSEKSIDRVYELCYRIYLVLTLFFSFQSSYLTNFISSYSFPSGKNPVNFLYYQFLVKIVGWTADSAPTEVKAADIFSFHKASFYKLFTTVPPKKVFHIPDAAHILRSSLQSVDRSLKYLSLDSDESFTAEKLLSKSAKKLKNIPFRTFCPAPFQEDFQKMNIRKTHNFYTNIGNLVNYGKRLPKGVKTPPKSSQMSFDQGILAFRVFVEKFDFFAALECNNRLQKTLAKLKVAANCTELVKSVTPMKPKLAGIAGYLSFAMKKNGVTLDRVVEELTKLVVIVSEVDSLEEVKSLMLDMSKKVPAGCDYESNAEDFFSSTFKALFFAFCQCQQNFTGTFFDGYQRLFFSLLMCAFWNNLKKVKGLLDALPAEHKKICANTIQLERTYGWYKLLEARNECGNFVVKIPRLS